MKTIKKDALWNNLAKVYLTYPHKKLFRFWYFMVDYIFSYILKFILPLGFFLAFYIEVVAFGYDPDINSSFADYSLLIGLLEILISIFTFVLSNKTVDSIGLKYSKIKELDSSFTYLNSEIVIVLIWSILMCAFGFLHGSSVLNLVIASIYLYYTIYLLIQEIPYFSQGKILEEHIINRLVSLKKREFRTGIKCSIEIHDIGIKLFDYQEKEGKTFSFTTPNPNKIKKYSSNINSKEIQNYIIISNEIDKLIRDINTYIKDFNNGLIDDKSPKPNFKIIFEDESMYDFIFKRINNYVTLGEISKHYSRLIQACHEWTIQFNQEKMSNWINENIKQIIGKCFQEIKNIDFTSKGNVEYSSSTEVLKLHYDIAILLSLLLTTLSDGESWFVDEFINECMTIDLHEKREDVEKITNFGFFYISLTYFLRTISSSENYDDFLHFCKIENCNQQEKFQSHICSLVNSEEWNSRYNEVIKQMSIFDIIYVQIYTMCFLNGIKICDNFGECKVIEDSSYMVWWSRLAEIRIAEYKNEFGDLLIEDKYKDIAEYVDSIEEKVKDIKKEYPESFQD